MIVYAVQPHEQQEVWIAVTQKDIILIYHPIVQNSCQYIAGPSNHRVDHVQLPLRCSSITRFQSSWRCFGTRRPSVCHTRFVSYCVR